MAPSTRIPDSPSPGSRLTFAAAALVALLLPPRLTPRRIRADRRYRRLDEYRFILWFLAAPVLIYVVFVVSPFLQAFFYSMTDWTGYSSAYTFTGFENYERLWNDDKFWDALRNSLLLLVAAPVITLALGLFFAFMLSAGGSKRRGEAVSGVAGSAFYKVVFFFPQVLSLAIIAVIWARVYSPRSGALNETLELTGLGGLRQNDWLGGDLAIWCVLAVLCWSFVGFYVVLFSAAMSSIPRETYEAALLDGASRPVTFFRITLPLTWDTVQTGWIYMGIQALDGFALVSVMVPEHGMDVVPTYLFDKAFRDGQAGYATAVGVALFVVTLLFAVLMMRLARRERIEY
ncbi:carbohydrate ABC transporter permease [Streptomyces sp. 7-21]|jgi:N-acetylglucosamine transport system permease protein|uniref:carbohydrate ABC transporter permease n=1 Tax=Streptomyces sp. 7-21 TaxID=2802283 RepID=UPI0019202741|nr:sugar ABC transporter permease [Streptomyces sp. 7-21]MBL1067057.1 sugar ABC transporter permease [Streptomyces sp. 7-21]